MDLNDILRDVDRRAHRKCLAVLRAVRRGAAANSCSLDEAERVFADAVLDAMLAADVRAQSLGRRWAASTKTIDAQLRKLPKAQREAVRKLYTSMARSASKRAMSHVRQKLLSSIEEGTSVFSALKGAGISREDPRLLATVTRTHSTMAFNARTFLAGQEDPDVWGYEYVTARDERVREEHRRLEGTRYPKGHRFWDVYAPPNGWNCRCMLRPVRKGSSAARTKPYRRKSVSVSAEFMFNPGKVVG